MKNAPSLDTVIQVEIMGPRGRIFSGAVSTTLLKLEQCVLELGGGSDASRFAFFQKGVIECATPPDTRKFEISEGCLCVREGRLTLICSCAQPFAYEPCACDKPRSPNDS